MLAVSLKACIKCCRCNNCLTCVWHTEHEDQPTSSSACHRRAPAAGTYTAALWSRCLSLKDLATVAVLKSCAHADEEAPCMKQEHAYARLAMPFDKLQKRHGSGDTNTATRCLCDAVIMQGAHSSCLAANLVCNFKQMCCAACRYWLFDDKFLCRFLWHQSNECTSGARGILCQPGQTEAQHFGDI